MNFNIHVLKINKSSTLKINTDVWDLNTQWINLTYICSQQTASIFFKSTLNIQKTIIYYKMLTNFKKEITWATCQQKSTILLEIKNKITSL